MKPYPKFTLHRGMYKVLPIFLLLVFLFSSCRHHPPEQAGEERVILGIFGGMGPMATADLYKQIVTLTPAQKDQDHIPTLIYSLPQVPDRMEAIRSGDGKIIPFLVEGVTRLENAGASVIAIPCNTVHYFYDSMQASVSIPIIHMIRETAGVVHEKYPDSHIVGLMATTGTIESGLYEKELTALGYKVITPDDTTESKYVMKAVWGIKAGSDPRRNEDLLAVAGQQLQDHGAEVIVLGCTEIPLAFNPKRVSVPVVNATEVLARKAIEKYKEITGNQ